MECTNMYICANLFNQILIENKLILITWNLFSPINPCDWLGPLKVLQKFN